MPANYVEGNSSTRIHLCLSAVLRRARCAADASGSTELAAKPAWLGCEFRTGTQQSASGRSNTRSRHASSCYISSQCMSRSHELQFCSWRQERARKSNRRCAQVQPTPSPSPAQPDPGNSFLRAATTFDASTRVACNPTQSRVQPGELHLLAQGLERWLTRDLQHSECAYELLRKVRYCNGT